MQPLRACLAGRQLQAEVAEEAKRGLELAVRLRVAVAAAPEQRGQLAGDAHGFAFCHAVENAVWAEGVEEVRKPKRAEKRLLKKGGRGALQGKGQCQPDGRRVRRVRPCEGERERERERERMEKEKKRSSDRSVLFLSVLRARGRSPDDGNSDIGAGHRQRERERVRGGEKGSATAMIEARRLGTAVASLSFGRRRQPWGRERKVKRGRSLDAGSGVRVWVSLT